MNNTQERWCSDHRQFLPAEKFYRTGNLCKACSKIRSREYSEDHRIEINASQKARRERLRTEPRGWAQYQMPILRQKAKENGEEFALTEDDLVQAIGDLTCPVTHVPMILEAGGGEASATVVRRDSNAPWVPANVGVLSRHAARILRSATPLEIFALSDWLEAHTPEPLTTISEIPAN